MKFEFDDMITAPRRLGILATLVPGESVSFTKMKTETSLSDGNLHVQSHKLANVGYIDIRKTKKGKRSITHFSITELGRERLREHVARLQKILDADVGTRNTMAKPEPEPTKNVKERPGNRLVRSDWAVWA
jgi:DNA-binding PadR family transcriptional regulator